MKCIFACWMIAQYQGLALTRAGANNRLLSFWELRDVADNEFLAQWVRDGFVDDEAWKTRLVQKQGVDVLPRAVRAGRE